MFTSTGVIARLHTAHVGANRLQPNKYHTAHLQTLQSNQHSKTCSLLMSHIPMENEELEQVDEFVYLGSVITQDGKCTKDTKRRIGLASVIVNKLSRIWKSHNLRVKVRLYKIFLVSVLVYESECWCLKKEDKRRIISAEVAWLRRLLCVTRRDRIRNDTIRSVLQQEGSLIQKMRKRRLT